MMNVSAMSAALHQLPPTKTEKQIILGCWDFSFAKNTYLYVLPAKQMGNLTKGFTNIHVFEAIINSFNSKYR